MLHTRSGSQGSSSAPPPPQSIEAVRRRARHRLIGAAILVLVAVLGFPLLFDTQPRPIPVDIPIEIPSRQATTPVAAETPSKPRSGPQGTAVAAADSLSAREEVVTPSAGSTSAPARAAAAAPTPVAVPDAASAKPVEAQPVPAKPVVSPEDKKTAVAAQPSPDSKPVAQSSGKPVAADSGTDKTPEAAAAGNERIVVQVGAFGEVERAREARLKLERAGLKTYTHVAETPQGRRIRVRLGPFSTKAEAEKAAARAKALGLTAQLLWL